MDELKEKGALVRMCRHGRRNHVSSESDRTDRSLVIGNEGEGVSRLVREKCDFVASIPMKGDIDSLNASVAAARTSDMRVVRQRLQKK